MKIIKEKFRRQFANRSFVRSFIICLVFLFLSLVVNYYASLYASERVSNPVTDIVLSNIPVYNVDAIFIYGPLLFWALIGIVCISDPKKIPFTLKSVALFVVIRSLFITLTHLGPFPDQIPVEVASTQYLIHTFHLNPNFFIFSSGGDLFFSGHTGLPFLLALVFWKHKTMRIICLIASLFFGVIVLLGHLHYSIDVLSAFFITYTIYHISVLFFKKDKEMFDEKV